MAKKTTKKKKQTGPSIKMLLIFYDSMVQEENVSKAASNMGIVRETLAKWLKKHKAFRIAKKRAKHQRENTQTLSGYLYQNLSEEAARIWNVIDPESEDPPTTQEKLERYLGPYRQGPGRRLRQELFLHAFVHFNFNISKAMRTVNISKPMLREWQEKDIDFQQALEEIHWHKKNFYENHLIGLVAERHPAAVIFANRTFNRDRGYSEKVEIENVGGGEAGGFNLFDLDLDADTQRKILDAIRRKKAQAESIEAEQVNALPEGTKEAQEV